MKRVSVCMWETVGGKMEFDVPDETDIKVFEQQISDELDSQGIKFMEDKYDSELDVTHRETDTCGVDLVNYKL